MDHCGRILKSGANIVVCLISIGMYHLMTTAGSTNICIVIKI